MKVAADLRWDERELANPCLLPNCAICIGLPMDCPAFLGSLRNTTDKTFAAGMVRDQVRTASFLDAAWNEYQEQIVVPANAACGKFDSQYGVTVLSHTTLEKLNELAVTKDVVVLLTHWEAPEFSPADILDPKGFLQLAEQNDHWVNREVLRGVRTAPRRTWEPFASDPLEHAGKRGLLAEFIAEVLNRLVKGATNRNEPNGREFFAKQEAVLLSRAGLGSVVRVLIESCFGDTIARGRCMELSNGMVSPWPLVRQPDSHSFVFDLMMCNSTEFAEMTRLLRPRMRIIGHFEPTNLPPCLLLLDRTFRILRDGSFSYLEARALAMLELREHFRKLI